jgi:hypothetical protein
MRKRTVRRVWALINPITHAMYQSSKLSSADLDKQITPVLLAIHHLTIGDWAPQLYWQPIFEALNRIESMLKLAHMPDHGLIARAQEVYVICLARYESTGACAFRADELATVREVGDVYRDLLQEITHADFQAACAHADANVSRVIRDKRGISVAGCRIDRIKSGVRA